MRIYLLPEHGNFYKVNMHSHSTLSDGHQTPEELKEIYKAHGYSAIAYTWHSMIFTDTDGQMYLSIHSPNSASDGRRETPVFIRIREQNGTLVCDLTGDNNE